jgi:hypothetical protein
MVEFALVVLPLLGLFCAILEFGYVLFLKTTFQHAVREGVRYAVTSRTKPGLGQDASIRAVVQLNAVGFLNGAGGASKIHIRYYSPATLAETQSNGGGNLVEVSIEDYQWAWVVPVLRSPTPTLPIVARSSDRMENSPGGISPPR